MQTVSAMLTRAVVCALALGVGLLILACGDGGAPPPDDPRDASTERGGVRLTIASDRLTYGASDPVAVKATVENTNDTPVTYTVRGENAADIKLAVVSGINGEQLLYGPEEPRGGSPTARTETLEPGLTLTRELVWDHKVETFPTPVQAPPGQYIIKTEFLLGEETDDEKPESMATSVVVEIEGSEPIITPQAAIRAAVPMPEVADWLKSRGNTLICALSGKSLFYNVDTTTGETFPTFQPLYEGQLADGLPVCSPLSEGDAWRVVLSARGSEPQRISAFVDIHDGTPLRVEEGGPQPTPAPAPSPSLLPGG